MDSAAAQYLDAVNEGIGGGCCLEETISEALKQLADEIAHRKLASVEG